MEYVYPAIFHKNRDESYTITYPDLPGCTSEGKPLGHAMYMAQSALSHWIGYLTDQKIDIPNATPIEQVEIPEGDFVNLIFAEVRNARAVKRTVSIPKWMDDMAVQSDLSLSRVLQDALSEKLE